MKDASTIFGKLQFQFPFRKYQRMILHQVESTKEKDNKFHIVAPPGSGKTIVGLELIKRFGHGAVVFAPTSTIQLQWKERIKMFFPEDTSLKMHDVVSTDPNKLKSINVFTYQLISSPSENVQFVEEAALFEWRDDLVGEGIALTAEKADERINTLRTNNPSAYKKELSKYYKRVKDRYLRDPEFDSSQFLHDNARKLIDDLVAAGVRVVVMDEVHHLLDYWALVIKELLKRIENPILIGLTATPPLSAGEEELENYLSLIDSIDFEIPTPAVVKEGNLAPYQDLVYFCKPTSKEKEFLDSVQERFQSLVSTVGQNESFSNWVHQRIIERPLSESKKQEWTAFFNSHPFLAIAGVKYLQQIQEVNLPREITEVEEMESDINIDDWVYLLTDYTLNFLKVSEDKKHHKELKEIRGILRSFGYLLTEKGIRQHRSLSDMILAFSEAKDEAMLKILTTEMQSMGKDLRAVVITDFEKQSATVAKNLDGILDSEAGGAVRAFRYIVHNKKTTKLEPILVTGSTVLVDTDELDSILQHMREWRDESGFNFDFETKETEYENIFEIVGSGKDWKSNTYVRMVTDLFDKGTIRCIVGTRGLLGEGWDSIHLNTLIDLTSATTSMTVNQIRGRSIRLNPEKPQKVANNWDIVCIEPSFERGNQDFHRFLKKHDKFYGLGSKGKIVRGFLHVDEGLAIQYYSTGFKKILYHLVNQRMLAKCRDRKRIYKAWKVGEEYSNFEYAATKLDAGDLKFKTVYSLRDSLKAIFRNIVMSIGVFAFWYLYIFGRLLNASFTYKPLLAVFSLLFVAGAFIVAGRNIIKYIKKGFIEIPLDSFLYDIGKSLLKALRESKLVDGSQSVDNVRVTKDDSGYYDIYLDYATREDAALFSKSLKELMAPVTNQRYLVSRSIDDVDLGFYSPLWWFCRGIFKVFKQQKTAYHGVPTVLSINKKRATNFAHSWREYVGGGRLIYTRSEEGRRLLLKLRAYNRHKIKRMNYEIWK